MSDTIEVRDLRQQDWVWTAKALLFHPKVDVKMYKVYNGLAAYSNNITQKAFPSIATLAEKLHMTRIIVMQAIGNLEGGGFIHIQRKLGEKNIYTLLDIPTIDTDKKTTGANTEYKPSEKTRYFFKGIADLRDKIESEHATQTREFLVALQSKYPNATKSLIWTEIQKFERYWTELNQSGTKERWQKETAFEVDRRLVTWFAKKDQFKKVEIINNNKGKTVEFARA